MNRINLNNNYSLIITSEFENFLDTKIFYESMEIGELLLTIHKEEVFIRQISINECYRRKGHSTRVVDALMEYFKVPVSLCVSKHSESAIKFWNSYFSNRDVQRIRGNIYKVA
jgi:ribosomal protein S18 acetylase RimI-like enzyme